MLSIGAHKQVNFLLKMTKNAGQGPVCNIFALGLSRSVNSPEFVYLILVLF